MIFRTSSFGDFLYIRICRVLIGSVGPIRSHSAKRIRNTFNDLRQRLPLPQNRNFWKMPGIMKRSGTNTTTRAGLSGPLKRTCHTFRRDGYVSEPHLDLEGYEADRDERRAFWMIWRGEKADKRDARDLDRAVFRDLYHFTVTKGKRDISYPYAYTEETFNNTVSNMAFFKADRKARDELFKAENIVIRRRRSKRR